MVETEPSVVGGPRNACRNLNPRACHEFVTFVLFVVPSQVFEQVSVVYLLAGVCICTWADSSEHAAVNPVSYQHCVMELHRMRHSKASLAPLLSMCFVCRGEQRLLGRAVPPGLFLSVSQARASLEATCDTEQTCE